MPAGDAAGLATSRRGRWFEGDDGHGHGGAQEA
jgi:hypothetical protein